MQSVTSEAATNVSFQSATPRPKPAADPSQGNDIFAGLVDSNTNNTAQGQSAQQNWPDNHSSTADNSRWRNSTSANPPANNNNNDNSGNQDANNGPASGANASNNTDAPPRSRSKPSASKDDSTKSTAAS